MATLAPMPASRWRVAPDARFFLVTAALIWLVLFLGFGNSFAQGRSSFGSPWYVHLHAAIFVGWALLYGLQVGLAATGSIALHRRLGWLALAWLPAMVTMGTAITVLSVRADRAPFFFPRGYFLIMDPLAVLCFAALTGAGLWLRRRTQWHRRLIFCGMALLTGPGWGRFVPIALLVPHAAEASLALVLLFPFAGMIRDRRVLGRVHPAYGWGVASIVGMHLLTVALSHSPPGAALWRTAMRGTPLAAEDPLGYPPFPPGFPIRHP